MFDDVKPQTGSATPPEDIFAGSDTTPEPAVSHAPLESAPAYQPTPSLASVPAPTNPVVQFSGQGPVPPGLRDEDKASRPPVLSSTDTLTVSSPHQMVKWVLIIGGVVVVVGVAILLAKWFLGSSKTSVLDPVPEPVVDVTKPLELPVSEPFEDGEAVFADDVGSETVTPSVDTDVPLDSDRDGLSDEEETALGTSVRSADTDNDGLSDRDEVKTWGTQVLNPDTDGDGFLDGEEVNNGYNPKGDGKLFEVPTS